MHQFHASGMETLQHHAGPSAVAHLGEELLVRVPPLVVDKEIFIQSRVEARLYNTQTKVYVLPIAEVLTEALDRLKRRARHAHIVGSGVKLVQRLVLSPPSDASCGEE